MGAGSTGDSNWGQSRAHRAAPTTNNRRQITYREAQGTPKGFKIEVYASGVANARTLRQGDKGTVFVSTRLLDKVYAINEQSGRREVKTLYSGLYWPNGLAFANGTLYLESARKPERMHGLRVDMLVDSI